MFFVLVVLPTFVLLVTLTQVALSSLYAASATQAREAGQGILKNLTAEANIVSYQAAALLNDEDLRLNVARYSQAQTPAGRAVASTLIDRNVINFLNYSNKAGTVAIRTADAGWYSYGNLSTADDLRGENQLLAQEAEGRPGRVIFADFLSGDVLTAALAPGPGDHSPELKALLLRLRVTAFEDLRRAGPSENRTEVVVLGRKGQVLLSTLEARYLAALLEGHQGPDWAGDRSLTLAGQVWLTSGQAMDATGWTLVTLRNEADLTARFRAYTPWVAGAALALVLLFLGYTVLFFSRIARPIQEVVRSMDLVGEGAWGTRVPPQGLKELAVLVDSFNRMSGEIVRLNHERVTIELDALRHQINPHFVANTLNVIKLMAATARMKSIEQMTGDLMVLLSDSYTGGASLTEVAAELKNIDSYVRIMKVRFNTGFDLEVDAPDDALDVLTLRMVLQPLVENAILHGFAGLTRRGRIVLRVRAEAFERGFPAVALREADVVQNPYGRLILVVEDNGVGMDHRPPATDPLQTTDRLARVGLDNVDRRIRLHFGEGSGLTVESQPDAFTRVTLVLPLLRRVTHA
jgi:two-component system sensor histidine kinase YesM